MMKRLFLGLLALALLSPAFGAFAGEVTTADAKTQTLKGEFQWNRQDAPGDLEAVFTPTGENTWAVSFHFVFRDEPHIYSGTAEGALGTGTLKGEVMSDGEKPQPFTFEGEFVDGKFSGKHAVKKEDGSEETGTLTLGK